MTTFTRLVNLTPHTVHLFTNLSPDRASTIPSSGEARVEELTQPTDPDTIRWDEFDDGGMFINVPLVNKAFGDVSGLPEAVEGTLYIVSALVQQACPGRTDLVSPHNIVRGSDGHILGCRGFARI